MERRCRGEHGAASSHGVDLAESAFLHPGADDRCDQPDHLFDVGGDDRLCTCRQSSIGGEELGAIGGTAAFDGDQGIDELTQAARGGAGVAAAARSVGIEKRRAGPFRNKITNGLTGYRLIGMVDTN